MGSCFWKIPFHLHSTVNVSKIYSSTSLSKYPNSWTIQYLFCWCIQEMKKTHFYLVDTSTVIPGAAVSSLQFYIIKEEPFVIHDIQVRIYDMFASLVILEIRNSDFMFWIILVLKIHCLFCRCAWLPLSLCSVVLICCKVILYGNY